MTLMTPVPAQVSKVMTLMTPVPVQVSKVMTLTLMTPVPAQVAPAQVALGVYFRSRVAWTVRHKRGGSASEQPAEPTFW